MWKKRILCLVLVVCAALVMTACQQKETFSTEVTAEERRLLPFSGRLLTFECGMRFLSDFLEGDVYFKVHRDGHNLDRCRTQFELVAQMERQADDLQKLV